MNDIHVTLRGNVATVPRPMTFEDGNSVLTFRLASNARWYDRERREWVDRGTTYVSVNCRRAMALNAAASLRKGHPVVLTGRLRERMWSSNGRSGQSLEVEAETLGHDLSFGTTEFVRIARSERAGRRGVSDVTGLPVLNDSDDLHDPDLDDPDLDDPDLDDPNLDDAELEPVAMAERVRLGHPALA